MEQIEKYLPPHCYPQQPLSNVKGIIIHYTSAINIKPDMAFDMETNWQLFNELNLPGSQRGPLFPQSQEPRYYASAHYLVGRDGIIWNLVPLYYKAWHAGVSELNGLSNCNNFTVGIEMVATHTSGYTNEQYISLSELTKSLMVTYNITERSWVTGHEHIACPIGRKKDPGPLFNWDYFYSLVGI